MNAIYHRQMLAHALSRWVSPRALGVITRANLGLDSLAGLLFHPEYHFDDSQFERSLAYIETCRQEAARAVDRVTAWTAFGRLTHVAQDFYAHSNFVRLWSDSQTLIPAASDEAHLSPPERIDGLDAALLRSPRLRSGRVYWPVEALWVFKPLRPWLKSILPRDSHAWMNLDNPAAGPLFPYALEAATQRTVYEFERTLGLIGDLRGKRAMEAFCDREVSEAAWPASSG